MPQPLKEGTVSAVESRGESIAAWLAVLGRQLTAPASSQRHFAAKSKDRQQRRSLRLV